MWVWVCEGLGGVRGRDQEEREGKGMKEKEVECNGVRIEGSKRGATEE